MKEQTRVRTRPHGTASGCRVRFIAMLALMTSVGCVSQASYEEARSAVEVEREAQRRTQSALAQAQRSLAELRAQVLEREASIAEQERKLAENDLDLKLANQERDESGELVTQLRGELARVGDHLRVYSEEKARLADELKTLEQQRNSVSQRAQRLRLFTEVVRDLSLLEADHIRTGAVQLATLGENPMLRVPSEALAPGGQLGGDASELAKNLAKLAALHEKVNFVLSEETGADPSLELPSAGLLRRLANALSSAGISSERVTLDVAEAMEGRAAPTSKDQPRTGDVSQIVFVLELGQPPASAAEAGPTPGN